MELQRMQSDEVNPYASPRQKVLHVNAAESERREANRLALNELGWPSFFLMLLSALWAGNGIMGSLLVALAMLSRGSMEFLDTRDAPFLVVTCTSSVLIFFGAWSMRRGSFYRLALATSFMACVPCLSPVVVLGTPFGFWALTVLTRPHVRSAFLKSDLQ